MARSYKRPWVKDKSRFHQNQAARHIRRLHWAVDVPDGKQYRKFYDPWSISDWRWQIWHPGSVQYERWFRGLYFEKGDRWKRLWEKDAKRDLHQFRKHCGNARARRKRFSSQGNGTVPVEAHNL